MADGVDRDTATQQAFDEVVEPLALARLLRVVVVDRQGHGMVDPVRGVRLEGLVREGEGVVDV